MQVQLSEVSQMPCSPKTKRPSDQIRNTADCEIAVLCEPKAAYSTLRRSLQMRLPQISRLEQLAAAASIRELDARRAVAVLCGNHMRYFVTSTAIDLGRSTNTLGKVMSLLCAPSVLECITPSDVALPTAIVQSSMTVLQLLPFHNVVWQTTTCNLYTTVSYTCICDSVSCLLFW